MKIRNYKIRLQIKQITLVINSKSGRTTLKVFRMIKVLLKFRLFIKNIINEIVRFSIEMEMHNT